MMSHKKTSPAKEPHGLLSLKKRTLPPTIGGKAESLRFLMKIKKTIPETFVIPWDSAEFFFDRSENGLRSLQQHMTYILDSSRPYAVRSSANVEDHRDHSFAGQFESILNIKGVEAIANAAKKIWITAHTPSLKPYLKKTGREAEDLHMAVIVQEMIRPVFSGVSFSKNPINGLDEVLIEAVEGPGTALVQSGVTPFRWINKWGGWIEKPDDSPLSLDLVREVMEQTKAISRTAGKDVDLEWVFDGKTITWLQMRDITAMTRMEVYSSRMAKEMTPGLIPPLVWSVVTPIPSRIWVNMITEVIGKNDIDPKNLVKAFYFRTYHNLSEFRAVFGKLGMPAESLEMMMGVTPPGAGKPPFKPGGRAALLIPRILRFIRRRWTFGAQLDKNYPRLWEWSRRYPLKPEGSPDENSLLSLIDEITDLNSEMTFYTINAILLMQIYNGILKSRLKKAGVDFRRFDLTEGMEELKEYDPEIHLDTLNRMFQEMSERSRRIMEQKGLPVAEGNEEIRNFQKAMDAFMEKFGHLSDTTGHFGSVPWRETPDLVIQLIADHEAPESDQKEKIRFADIRIARKGRRMLRIFYERARKFRLYREKFSSLYSYTLMLFRVYYLELGRRMTERGKLRSSEEIYFLYDREIRSYAGGKETGEDFMKRVEMRKNEMEDSRDAVLPEIIFGSTPPPITPEIHTRLKGTATSQGYTTAFVKVIRGLADFSKLEKGDVLVIPYSDVSWTPLFSKAGAVVAESGGMLSHSSIIAREYGIPAVVSVNGALTLKDGTLITVDGFTGDVLLHDEDSREEATDDL